MNILAIDTASTECSLSLWQNKSMHAEINQPMERGHAAFLGPLCQKLLKQCNLPVDQLDLILINIGPGSFTGIRVGLAFAKGLADATQTPLKGITGFDAALAAQGNTDINQLVVLDARRDDYYCQLVVRGHRQQPISMNQAEINELQKKYNPRLLGTGVSKLTNTSNKTEPPYSLSESLVLAYHQGLDQTANPYYLRQPDVNRAA